MSAARVKPISKITMAVYLVFVLLFVVIPIWYAFTGAFRASNPSSLWEHFWPTNFTWDNFSLALTRVPLGRQLVNTVLVTLFQTALQTITALLAAAALVFGRLRHPNWYFTFILFTMMLPSESIIVSKFLLINEMGLFDTLLAVFLPFAAMAFPIFLLRQAFLSFPLEIREAATLDGVGPLRFLFQFLIPLCKPIVFSVVITSAIAAWNGYLWPLLVTESAASRTVQVGISQLSDAESTDVGVVLAGLTMVSIPMVILVMFGNKFLTRGLTEGSSK